MKKDNTQLHISVLEASIKAIEEKGFTFKELARYFATADLTMSLLDKANCPPDAYIQVCRDQIEVLSNRSGPKAA